MDEIIKLSTYLFRHVVFAAGHPEGEYLSDVVVIRVHSDILHEVVEFIFVVHVWHHVIARVVGGHYVSFDVAHSGTSSSRHLQVLCFLHHARIEEIVRVDLIDRWQSHVFTVASVEYGNGERHSEHAAVHAKSGPTSSFVERLEVLGVVEQLEQHFHFVHVLGVEWCEDGITDKEHSLLVPPKELLYDILKQVDARHI